MPSQLELEGQQQPEPRAVTVRVLEVGPRPRRRDPLTCYDPGSLNPFLPSPADSDSMPASRQCQIGKRPGASSFISIVARTALSQGARLAVPF